ncbi:MAG TPA: sn-glycerol-3-phosphate ABC transporter ATP-binding protein UgpC [Candidatus Binatia bacterium]
MNRLSKRFGAAEVLKDISFDVADGEFCVLLGPSGCGKSTVLRLIAGLEQPSGGEICIDAARVDALAPRERDIAFVFQNYALYPHMTVFDNLAFALRLRSMPMNDIRPQVKETARLLEIEDLLERRPQALSGGQRQRVALGRAIVRQPRIFLFDEPLSNLDATLRASMRVELARLHRRLRATIVYVTHDQAEALTLGEKIIVLNQGTIQQIGAASEIYHKPANMMVARFVGSPQMNFFSGKLDDNGARLQCSRLRLDLADLLQNALARLAGQALTVGVRPEDFHVADEGRAWISGAIDLIEDLGSDRFLHVKCDGIDLVARVGREITLRAGDTIDLNVAPDRLHFFRDGRRIEP